MRHVYEIARELGEAIRESEPYRHLQALEQEAAEDEQVRILTEALSECRKSLAASEDAQERAGMESEYRALEARRKALPVAAEMDRARKALDEQTENINRILRLILTGQPETEETPACCRACGTCASCRQKE